MASRRSFLIRSPGRRGVFDGATATQFAPRAVSSRYVPYPHGPASYAKNRSCGRPSRRTSLRKASGLLGIAPYSRTSPLRPGSATATWIVSFDSSKPMNRVVSFMTGPPHVALRHGWVFALRSVTHGLRMGRSIHDVYRDLGIIPRRPTRPERERWPDAPT